MKKIKSLLAAAFIAITMSGSKYDYGAIDKSAMPAPIIDLIVNSDRYDGETIFTVGFLVPCCDDGYALSYNQYYDELTSISLNLDLIKSKDSDLDIRLLDKHHVRVEGTFYALGSGEYRYETGKLNVTRIFVKFHSRSNEQRD